MTRRTLLNLPLAAAARGQSIPRLEAVPEPHGQIAFQRDRQEIARLHYARDLRRPFVYPLIGPAGRTLTRMGHPGDPQTHSHHNSVWISHADVNGVDFWSDRDTAGRIVVEHVARLEDDEGRAGAVTEAIWRDASGKVLLRETRKTWVEALDGREWLLVIDLELKADVPVTFAASAFGPIGVRVAKWMSVQYGDGRLLNSEGAEGETAMFRKPARWVDYSGSVLPGVREGLALFDHPMNPRHPSAFHVREDGWMGALLSVNKPVVSDRLHVRYGVYVHGGAATVADIERRWQAFAKDEARVSRRVEVASPDGRVRVHFESGERITYGVTYRGETLVGASALGLTLEGSGFLGRGMRVEAVRQSEQRGEWKPPYGERSVIPDNYNEALIELRAAEGRRLDIAIRAYNEGAALQYRVPGSGDVVIESEQTEFALPSGTRAWQTLRTQQQYECVWAKDLHARCERPLTLEYASGKYAAIVEASLRDYPVTLLSPAQGWTLVTELSTGRPPTSWQPDFGDAERLPVERAAESKVRAKAPFATPWRAVIVGDRPGDLLERNYLLQNLSPPSEVADTSWIKPGKVIREVTLSTKGAKEAIDFAVRRNLQYVEFDAGWYGHEYDDRSVARAVNVDPLRLQKDPAYRGLDLPEVLRYAKQKGIGIWLYVNRRALEQDLSHLLPLYKSWGVAGLKYGFVHTGSQFWTRWVDAAVALAAKHRLMVDIHDEFRPTGVSRTFPNLLTQEGILGNEGMPPAEHNTVMPFTRFVAGAADYTVCYYTERIKTTRAHQLALTVVFYSPLQFLYWYDRPSAYAGEPEIEFFDRVPTVWDETRVIDGEIGQFATVARRSGDDWFVGTINNGVPRRRRIPLAFLAEGKRYRAHIYENGRDAKQVNIATREVDRAGAIDAVLPPAGGQAIWLELLR